MIQVETEEQYAGAVAIFYLFTKLKVAHKDTIGDSYRKFMAYWRDDYECSKCNEVHSACYCDMDDGPDYSRYDDEASYE